jgi:hypothetical protein
MEEAISDGRKARLRPSMSAAKRLQHIAAGYLLELYLKRNGYPAVFFLLEASKRQALSGICRRNLGSAFFLESQRNQGHLRHQPSPGGGRY